MFKSLLVLLIYLGLTFTFLIIFYFFVVLKATGPSSMGYEVFFVPIHMSLITPFLLMGWVLLSVKVPPSRQQLLFLGSYFTLFLGCLLLLVTFFNLQVVTQNLLVFSTFWTLLAAYLRIFLCKELIDKKRRIIDRAVIPLIIISISALFIPTFEFYNFTQLTKYQAYTKKANDAMIDRQLTRATEYLIKAAETPDVNFNHHSYEKHWIKLANIYRHLKLFPKAERTLKYSVDYFEEKASPALTTQRQFKFYNNIFQFYLYKNSSENLLENITNLDQFENICQKTLNSLRLLHPNGSRQESNYLNIIASRYSGRKNYLYKAIEYLEKAISVEQNLSEPRLNILKSYRANLKRLEQILEK